MDETLRELGERVTVEIRGLKGDCDAHFYGIGARLVEVRALRLYEAVGYARFLEYLEEAVDIGLTQAYNWMAVAENYSPELAAQFGVAKCRAFLRYVAATPEDDQIGRAA